MITPAQYRQVADVVKDIADTEIYARFRKLGAGDVTEKGPGDLVTVADQRAEARLAEELQQLLPGSVTVGEEAAAADPDVLNRLRRHVPTWIVDPVDGTANFVAGDPDYACLVSLSIDDVVHASWIYAPSLDLTAGAHTGVGAWVDGKPARLRPRPEGRTLDVVTAHHAYGGRYQHVLDTLDAADIDRADCRAAGLSYVDLVRGLHDALIFTWEKPWDHAAGLHLHACAGGTNSTMDGKPFALAGDNALPFVVADESTVQQLLALLSD